MKKEFASIEIGRYKIYHNGKKFIIYEVTGQKIKSCKTIEEARKVITDLQNHDDIVAEANRLNKIKER